MGFNPIPHMADLRPPISFIISQSTLAWVRHTLIEFMYTGLQLVDGHIKDDGNKQRGLPWWFSW